MVFLAWLPRWNQVFFAISNQIRAPHSLQCITQDWPVLRCMVAQEGLVQPPLPGTTYRTDSFRITADFLQRVTFGMVHRRSDGQWCGQKGLHLVKAEVIGF